MYQLEYDITFFSNLLISSLFSGIVHASSINLSASTRFGIDRKIPKISSKEFSNSSFSMDFDFYIVLLRTVELKGGSVS